MKLYNKSARPHWIGNVLISPLATEEVGDEWRGAYNASELVEVTEEATEEVAEESPKRNRKPKAAE